MNKLNRVTTDGVRLGNTIGASKERESAPRCGRCDLAMNIHYINAFRQGYNCLQCGYRYEIDAADVTPANAVEAGRTEYERVTRNPKETK